MSEFFVNYPAQTTLLEGIDSSDTTLQIVAVPSSPTTPQFRIRIDNEIMLVTGVAGTMYTVVRGIEGTVATAHERVIVRYVLTAAALGEQTDPVATIPGLRSLGTGAQQAAAGNDARFTALPTLHAMTHHSGGSDPLAGQSIAGLLTSSTPTFAGLNFGGHLIPSTNDAFNIGTESSRVSTGYFGTYGVRCGSATAYIYMQGAGSYGLIYNHTDVPLYIGINETIRWIVASSANGYALYPNVDNGYDLGTGDTHIRSGYFATSLILTSSANLNWNGDTFLVREAANTLAMRNGASPQTFYLYNTYTDAANYERLVLLWSANTLYFFTDKAGSGIQRAVVFDVAAFNFRVGGTNCWTIATDGIFRPDTDNSLDIGYAGIRVRNGYFATSIVNSGYDEFIEMTEPAAGALNTARLFSKDNGSGKTQLCVRFNTGAVQVLSTEP